MFGFQGTIGPIQDESGDSRSVFFHVPEIVKKGENIWKGGKKVWENQEMKKMGKFGKIRKKYEF